MFLSGFTQEKLIIICPRTIICNTFEQINVSGNILNSGGNVVDREYYGFTGSFFKVSPIVIDDITKNKLMKMKITPMMNNDEQQLNHPICEIKMKDKRIKKII